ncbi:hypothetical protein M0811_13622 [Anaeramoeba ignava]|uniref:Heat shock protein 70 n=1 Tax=Anaeramoeba ignava TaxID=1746090 RepID=A0A9Q0L641_ANAIG|nr:hypothetical protein M0811_13622 [Anaeramoeba ignava]
MSTIGFDFGTEKSVVAIAQSGGVDVLQNEFSERETLSIIHFESHKKTIGTNAEKSRISNHENILILMKRMLGKKIDEEIIKKLIESTKYSNIIEGENKRIEYQISYGDSTKILSAEQATAIMLSKLQEIAQFDHQTKETVLSYPIYFTDKQRCALIDSAKISGINLVGMISEPLAISIAYGFPKRNFPPINQKPYRVCFVDFGASHITSTITEFWQGKMQIISTAFDNNIGGYSIDNIIYKKVSEMLFNQFAIDVNNLKHKMQVRLLFSCISLKKKFSRNQKEAVIFGNFTENQEVSLTFKFEDFEQIISSEIEKAISVVEKSIILSKLEKEEIDSIEIVGGSSRILLFKKKLTQFFGKSLSTTMHTTECVARGCAYHAVLKSSRFGTKPFEYSDIYPFGVSLSWTSDAEDIHSIFTLNPISAFTLDLVQPFQAIPVVYQVHLVRNLNFILQIQYSSHQIKPFVLEEHLQEDFISQYLFSLQKASVYQSNESLSSPKIIQIIPHFYKQTEQKNVIFPNYFSQNEKDYKQIEMKENHIQENEMNLQKNNRSLQKISNFIEKDPRLTILNGNENQNENQIKIKNQNQNENQNLNENKNQYEYLNQYFNQYQVSKLEEIHPLKNENGMKQEQLQNLIQEEMEMEKNHSVVLETENARNELEKYAYTLRKGFEYQWTTYITQQHVNSVLPHITDLIDWIYSEGYNETKQEYQKRLQQLHSFGDPIENRKLQFENISEGFQSFSILLDSHLQNAIQQNQNFSISHDDFKLIQDKTSEMRQWIEAKSKEFSVFPMTEDPPFDSLIILQKQNEYEKFCQNILNSEQQKTTTTTTTTTF